MKPLSRHARVGVLCAGMTASMLGAAYAAVPLYKLFCQVTGYAGTTQRVADTSGEALEQTITVRFDANISSDLDWSFEPKQRSIVLPIGEKRTALYVAKNLSSRRNAGTATFNVSPPQAGAYFNKIECFCFTEQQLAGGEQVDMPVVFFVDPEIAKDPLLKDLDAITLSYTFFVDEDAKLAGTVPAKPRS